MATIKPFDSASVQILLSEFEEALRSLAEKYGLAIDRKGLTYQFSIKQVTEDGKALSADAKEFVQSPKTPTQRWGWPLNARKAHVFLEARSLCGKWGFFGSSPGEPVNENQEKPGPDDCIACFRAAKKVTKNV